MPPELFAGSLVERPMAGKSLCASAAIHAHLILLVLAWRFIGPTQKLPYKPRTYEVHIVRYSLPEPLLFAASGRQGDGPGGGSRGAAPGRGTAPALPGAPRLKIDMPVPALPQREIVAAEPPGLAPPKPAFRIPEKAPVTHRDLIIQPEFKPDIRITGKVDLPNLFLWSQREIRPPVRQLKTFVPGEIQRHPRSPQALPDAVPKLELPNQEVKVTDLKISSAPQVQRPALPVFAATTSPVRIPRKTLEAPSELPVTALPPGEPVNLLAIMDRPAPPSPSYSTEAGNRFPQAETEGGNDAGSSKSSNPGPGPRGASASAEGAAAGPAGSGTGAANGTPGGMGSSGRGGSAAGPGSGGTGRGAAAGSGRGLGTGAGGGAAGAGAGRGRGSGSGSGAGAGAVAGMGGRGSGSGSGIGAGGVGSGSQPGGAGTEIAAVHLGSNSVAIRTESPNTSSFDVVVVNQNAREILPESQGILTGQPIYTVYMSVAGSRREWILQYTVPNSREPVVQTSPNSVQLGAATPIRAPYPLRKASLQLPSQAPVEGRVVVYGDISDKGALENLRVIRGVRSEIDAAVLACLRQFVFRPAVRDGVPVPVEALFGIPLN
jgi:hypothetical protein|nr:energy transducer TonB [Bryobacterales bacterium]